MLQQPLWSTLSTQKEEKVLSAFLVPSGEREHTFVCMTHSCAGLLSKLVTVSLC